MRLVNKRSKTEIDSIAQPARRFCIAVLGMHRSGTSVLTGVLGLLGATLPKNIIPSNTSNPKGYFEPKAIVALHDEMLSALGSSWIDFRRLDLSKFDPMVASQIKARLVAILADEYDDATNFVVKDPRMCRFFPFWRDVIQSFGAETRVILTIRNPLEVARSLAQRDELSNGYCLNLWLRHILDAEFDTRQSKRIVVANTDFMRDWMHVIKKIESDLDIELSERTPNVQATIEALIDRDMRHYVVDEETLAVECQDHPVVIKAYRALKQLIQRSDDREAMNALDEVRQSFDESTRMPGYSFGSDLIYVQTKLYSARARIKVLEAQANEVSLLKERLRQAESRVHESEAVLAERSDEMTLLNAQMLALQDRNKQNLTELVALRKLREVNQERISKLGSLLEQLWANEFRQKNEQRQLEEHVARLTTEAANIANELQNLKSSLSRRLAKPFRLFTEKLRGPQV